MKERLAEASIRPEVLSPKEKLEKWKRIMEERAFYDDDPFITMRDWGIEALNLTRELKENTGWVESHMEAAIPGAIDRMNRLARGFLTKKKTEELRLLIIQVPHWINASKPEGATDFYNHIAHIQQKITFKRKIPFNRK